MIAAVALNSVAFSFLLLSTITSTSPVNMTENDASSELTESMTVVPDVHPTVGVLSNGSKIVITNVIKTVEFDVALEDDDDSSTAQGETTPAFIETGIKIFDPELLNQVISALGSTASDTDSN